MLGTRLRFDTLPRSYVFVCVAFAFGLLLLLNASMTSKVSGLPPHGTDVHYPAPANDDYSVDTVNYQVDISKDSVVDICPDGSKSERPATVYDDGSMMVRTPAHHSVIKGYNHLSSVSIPHPYNHKKVLPTDGNYVCEVGATGWTLSDMRSHFLKWEKEVYSSPHAPDGLGSDGNKGGIGLFHGWWLSYVVHKLQPKHVIESGAHKGVSTWLIRQAAPHAQIIVISPEIQRVYRDTARDTVYCSGPRFKDFNELDFDALGIDKERTVIFFDDHQSEERRMWNARESGFRHIIFDDNFPPENLDNFSVKQACDAKDRKLWNYRSTHGGDTYTYADNFGNDNKEINSAEMNTIFDKFMKYVEIYQEGRPIYKQGNYFCYGGQGDFTYGPLFDSESPEGSALARKYGENQSFRYVNSVYVRLKNK